MGEERFKLSKSAIPSQLSNFYDENSRMLNSEVVKYLCKAYDECLKRQGTNKPLPCMVNWMMGRTFKNMFKETDDG